MSTMLDYINEEQEVLSNILNKFNGTVVQDFKEIRNILVLATGSSYNACLAAKPAMEKIANISIVIEEPYNFNQYGKLSESVDAVLAVSQSGKSTSTIEAISKLIDKDIITLALTSNLESELSVVDHIIDLNMGVESVGFVTKGYSATLLQLILLSMCIGLSNGFSSKETIDYYYKELRNVIDHIPSIIERSNQFFIQHESILKIAKRFIAIGYGPNWGTAKEFETKFSETVRQPSQGFELEAYMHGPYLEANNEQIIFFIDTFSNNLSRSNLLESYMKAYVGKTFIVTTEKRDDENILNLDLSCDEFISPLALVIPFQLLSYKIATSKGINLDKRIFNDFDSVLKSKVN